MKTLKFTFPIFIILSLLSISMGLAEDTLATSSDIVYQIPVVQTREPAASADSLTDSVLPDQFNDPYVDRQWALSQIQVRELWQTTSGGAEILVAVLDTGIDRHHEDLDGKVVIGTNFTESPTLGDTYGHGTHIAGIIAACGNNGVGIVGVAPESQLMNVKVADDTGGCQASTVAKGIIWAVDNGASVINVSIEFKEPSPELEAAVNYAWNQGAVIIAAAGNEGNESPVYPACYENCIAVAAVRQDNTLAPLSNYGDWIDVAAPGFNIYSTLPDDSYGYKSGTSFASAYVSGMAAMLFSMVTDTNGDGKLNDEVRAAILNSCQQISTSSTG